MSIRRDLVSTRAGRPDRVGSVVIRGQDEWAELPGNLEGGDEMIKSLVDCKLPYAIYERACYALSTITVLQITYTDKSP